MSIYLARIQDIEANNRWESQDDFAVSEDFEPPHRLSISHSIQLTSARKIKTKRQSSRFEKTLRRRLTLMNMSRNYVKVGFK